MEHANRWLQLRQANESVRVAQQSDIPAITRLLRDAPFSHIHADWHYPIDWLGMRSFVVVPSSSSPDTSKKAGRVSNPPFNIQQSLDACLAIAAEPQPAAWVRLAAISDKGRGRLLMASMLSATLDALRDAGTSEIAWLLVDDWPETWLPDLGFMRINEVVTYVKFGTQIPQLGDLSHVEIRSVESADIPALAAIESRAFKPLWRYSELGLSLAKQQAFSFDVALLEQEPVGFQFSSKTLRGAHLSRITVDPQEQNGGVGTALLAHAFQEYARQGVSTVTLNTQIDNFASKKLYERFGFVPNDEYFPVWGVGLAAAN